MSNGIDLPARGEAIDPGDLKTVRIQIGHLRYEPLAVLSRCPAGFPQVVLGFASAPDVSPARRRFSKQVVWLTCPHIRAGIARLESAGLTRTLGRSIADDPTLREGLEADQAHYEEEARTLLARRAPWAPVGEGRFGIGGVRATGSVKCLHAHVAWTLATGRGEAGRQTLVALEDRAGDRAVLCEAGRCPGLPP